MRRFACAGLAVALVVLGAYVPGCASEGDPPPGELPADPTLPVAEPAAPAALSPSAVRAYMREVAPYLVSRELEIAEIDAIDAQGTHAIVPILKAWTKEDAFARALRRLVSQKLSVSGTKDGIDFDLPGNLAEDVVRRNLPLRALLTADYCVDAKGARGDCDTGAPFKAGVLGTRAYLVSRASRFNLSRARTMLNAFACQAYPMPPALQPRIDAAKLIPLFASNTETGPDGKPKVTFGNGTGCYTCHGQFGVHAQVFVRFDSSGKYRPEATGLQDPAAGPGVALGGLFASHLNTAAEAKDEASQMFGKPVKTLQEAARVLAENPTFVPCQVRNLLEYALRLGPSADIAADVVTEIATRASAPNAATFATLVIETFSHPRVVQSVVRTAGGSP